MNRSKKKRSVAINNGHEINALEARSVCASTMQMVQALSQPITSQEWLAYDRQNNFSILLSGNHSDMEILLNIVPIGELRLYRHELIRLRRLILSDYAKQSIESLHKREEILNMQENIIQNKEILEEKGRKKRKDGNSWFNSLKGFFGFANKDYALADQYYSQAVVQTSNALNNTMEVNRLQEEHIQITIQRETKLNTINDVIEYIDMRIDQLQSNPLMRCYCYVKYKINQISNRTLGK